VWCAVTDRGPGGPSPAGQASDIWCGNEKKQGTCRPKAPHPDARVLENAELRGRIRSAPAWLDINNNGTGEHEVAFDFEPEIGWMSTLPNAINRLDQVVRFSTPVVPNGCLSGSETKDCYGESDWRLEDVNPVRLPPIVNPGPTPCAPRCDHQPWSGSPHQPWSGSSRASGSNHRRIARQF